MEPVPPGHHNCCGAMAVLRPQFYFMPPHVAPQNVTPASEVQSVAQVTAPGNLPQTGGDDQRHTSTSNDNSNSAASNQGRASILRRLLGLPDTLRSTTDSSTLGSHTSQDLGDPAEELVADVLQSDRESATAGSASQTTSFGNTGASTLGYTPGVLSAVYFSDRPADMVLPQEFAKRVGLGHAQVRTRLLNCCRGMLVIPTSTCLWGSVLRGQQACARTPLHQQVADGKAAVHTLSCALCLTHRSKSSLRVGIFWPMGKASASCRLSAASSIVRHFCRQWQLLYMLPYNLRSCTSGLCPASSHG
jgi:hypothetical protein